MSTDTLSTTDMVVKDELNSSTTNNQETESSINGILHSDNNQDINESSMEEQNESIQNTYNDNGQTLSSNKNDLEPEALRKVFIGGLSYKTEDQTFRDYFSKFGDIDDCIIMRDRENRSRGFGFVTYLSSTMVDKLMAARPHVLDAREIEPKRAIPKEESGKPESALSAKKLFVGGIREGTINEDDLKEYFSKYGHIVQTVIMKTNEGKFRGFGFVEFNDYDPVDKIVLEKHHVIKGNPVNVEKALPKEQTNRGRMSQSQYGGSGGSGGGMRGQSSRMGSGNSGGGSGGWGPMGGGQNFGGAGGGNGGYRSVGGGGYGAGGDYGNRPAPYGGGYGGDMGSGGMVGGYGGSGPMGGNDYGMGGSGRGNYNDNFGSYNQPSGFGFGENYGSSSGGPVRRGGGGRGGGAPYNRGGGRGGFRGRNQQ
ncbi:unnamed protein product [Rotaria sp. Silwood1]|nr:unnamed protein product [Rotaria sp. Silwood1]CAF3468842.1 unnamed protein product [Rotaria sp. Silwood1]CAF4612410.1 unnamed protein product [Rotaria sp. Silwood1]CAF4830639.1 unnamed protein product [Rotaria sp. Silwood1]